MPTSTTKSDPHEALEALIRTVSGVAASGRLPVVVLDLDSTLIDTGHRHHRIVLDYLEAHGSSSLKATLADLSPQDFGYLVEEPIVARGVTDPDLIADLRQFWWSRFLTDAYCRHDQAAPGAVAYVQRLLQAGAMAYYLTARPADMAQGTVDVLVRCGFPVLRGRTVLHLKPARTLDDHRYKRGALTEIRSLHGVVCGSFENEPAHAGALLKAFPEGTHFLVGEIRSPTAPDPHPSLVLLPSFAA